MNTPTFRIVDRTDEGRPQPFAVKWNEYPYGPGTKPARRSQWFTTRADAERFIDLTLAALNGDETPTPSLYPPQPTSGTRTLDGFLLHEWLPRIKTRREAGTYKAYETNARIHIIPALGRVKVNDTQLTPNRLLDFYDQLAANGASLSLRRSVHRTVSTALTYALQSNLLSKNPALTLGLTLRQKGEAPRVKGDAATPFSVADAKRFLDWLKTHDADWWEYFLFLHDTGVRVGELGALKWHDDDGVQLVDFDAATAKIHKSWSTVEKADKATKTHQNRTVDLTDRLVAALADLQQRQRRETLRAGRSRRRYVMTNSAGGARRQNGSMRRAFDRALAAIRLDVKSQREDRPDQPVIVYTPHSLRDTFATSHLAQNWGKLGWVSMQLGHESPATTEKHYWAYRPTAVTKRWANDITGG